MGEDERSDELVRALENSKNTMIFALLWLHPEGDRKTFAEVLFRAVTE